jgi:hypothetical protein
MVGPQWAEVFAVSGKQSSCQSNGRAVPVESQMQDYFEHNEVYCVLTIVESTLVSEIDL